MNGNRHERPTGTVTVVLGDVEGSTTEWLASPDSTSDWMKQLDALLSERVEAHSGIRPQGEGDSFVAVFGRPTDALAFAVELQGALGRDQPHLRVRIGIHTGEIEISEDGRYMGATLSRCARIRDLAHGGQTLVSLATFAVAADRLPADVTLDDLGLHELRGLARPERVFQLGAPDLRRDFPPLASPTRPRHNLPLPLTSFVGRAAELSQLSGLLVGTRCLTLTGAGGCGKTRLALELARDLVHEYPDGVWWVDLAPLNDPDLVPGAVASAVGVRPVPNEDLTPTLLRQLRERRLALLVDNCEHVVAAIAALTEGLLRGCPGVTVLATSREPLGVPGETAWRVPSLPVPPTADGPSLERFDSVRLFVERAGRVRPSFRLTPDNAEAVALVCRRLDGIPLAIELAAAQARLLSPHQIADELAGSFRLLTGGHRSALPRQRTLEASVDWSYNLLAPPERTLMARVSVFAGGFTLEAAEAVCAGDGIDAYDVFDLLARLVDKSLVQVEQGPEARYRLLESIRYFAQRRLVDSGEAPEVRDRHLAFYLALAEVEEPGFATDMPRAIKQLDAENDNLRAALDWGLQSSDGERAMRLVGGLGVYWMARGRHAEGVGWARAALALPCEEPVARFEAIEALAGLFAYLGELRAGYAAAEEGVAIARSIGDGRRLGEALQNLGFSALFVDRPVARSALEEGIDLLRREGDERFLVDSLYTLSLLETTYGDLVSARALSEECVEVARRANRQSLPIGLYFFGWVARLQGDLATAEAVLRDCMATSEDTGDPVWSVLGEELFGDVLLARGDLVGAERHLAHALASGQEWGNPFAAAFATWHLGHLAYMRGELEAAATHLEDAIPRLDVVAVNWAQVLAQLTLGDVAAARGDQPAAIEAWGTALAMAQRTENPFVIGRAQQRMARVESWDDDPRRAEDLVHEALQSFVAVGDRLGPIEALEDLARLAARHESWAESVRLLAAARAQREATGYARPPIEVEAYDLRLAELEATLGPEEFAAVWAEGGAMSAEAAVAYARKRRGTRKRPSTGWASLTPTELQVAELVAEGLANPAIAERMFVTRGTVKIHLSHIFAKLGIANRTELATLAVRRGGQA